jgi:predicted transcriptional regulator of viral defense system
MTTPHNTQLAHNEGHIALAMQAIEHHHFSSVRAAAQTYNVSKSTLRRRATRISRKLSTIEESTFIEWISPMGQRSLTARNDSIRQMANLHNTLTVGKQ